MEKNNRLYNEIPDGVILEWELLRIIISFLELNMYNPRKQYEPMDFTYYEIKDFYKEITNNNFNKIYGKDGLNRILSFRDGVEYDYSNKTWIIYPNTFINHLNIVYKNDEEKYGFYFDK